MVVASRRRHALLALAAVAGVLALPLLHPGVFAHRGDALDAPVVLAASGGGDVPTAFEDHLRCPLCRGLAQARAALASPAFRAPAPAGPARLVAGPPLPAAPGDPARDAGRARAPPLPA
jgi:hypothetical protein